jgi:beta-lactamase class A
MKILINAVFGFALICLFLIETGAQTTAKTAEIAAPKNYRAIVPENSPQLQTLLNRAVGEMLNSYPPRGFKSDDVSAVLIDLRDAANPRSANFRGEAVVYPASVVKMFYMAALERQLEDGKIKTSPELERGLKDMIVDSSNEATQYILDVLTGTSSGAEMPAAEFTEWSFKRNTVNRFYSSLGYEKINVNQKTHCEDAYGREQQFRNYKGENRNMLTTTATARLLAEIVTGRIVAPDRTRTMMDLMRRDAFAPSKDPDNQANGFTGKALIERKMTDARLWSKAGWTSKSRHDAAYVETADGLKFVLVVFTENHANEQAPIPTIAGKIIDGLKEIKY